MSSIRDRFKTLKMLCAHSTFGNTINYSDINGGRALFTNMIKNMDAAAQEKMINDVELPDNYHDYTTQRGLFVRRDYILY